MEDIIAIAVCEEHITDDRFELDAENIGVPAGRVAEYIREHKVLMGRVLLLLTGGRREDMPGVLRKIAADRDRLVARYGTRGMAFEREKSLDQPDGKRLVEQMLDAVKLARVNAPDRPGSGALPPPGTCSREAKELRERR